MTETETTNDEQQSEDTADQMDPSLGNQSHSQIRLMERMVLDHGEVHAICDEHDSFENGTELEIRRGTTEFSYETETIIIQGADTQHFIPMDSIVRYYLPMEISH